MITLPLLAAASLRFLLAKAQDDTGILIAAIVIAILIVVPIFVVRGMRKSRGAAANDTVAVKPGEVRIVFHTYTGFLVWVTQRTYDVIVPAEQAQAMLKGWLKHNLTYGLFAYGGIFVPILTFFEYRSQSKKVALALQRGFPVVPKS